MIYPPVLGNFLADGYAYQIDPGIAKTKLQSKLIRYRETASARTMIDVSMKTKIQNMAIAEAFFQKDARNWFDAIVIIDGEVASKTVRLYEFGKVSKKGGLYSCSMTLELYEHANEYMAMTSEERECYYNYDPFDLVAASASNPLSPLFGI
jgi:hypothetical protein